MTSRISAVTDLPRRTTTYRGAGRQAFTLVEMLVVISVIIILAGILLPAINKAYKKAQRTATANDLQAIASALEAYKQDFGDYPRVVRSADLTAGDKTHPNPMTGAQVLCFALMGPGPAVDPLPPAAGTMRADQD